MNLTQVTSIYFSPTDSTKQAVELIAEQIPGSHESLDLTGAKYRPDYCFSENEAVLVGVPVYGGRVPVTAAERIRKLHGKQTPAILVVAYGNRAYEDALLELKNLLVAQGFRPAAAAAVVTEHNIVRSIAAGRPDAEDQRKMKAFGRDVARKLGDTASTYQLADLSVKGNEPYKTYHTLPLKIRVSSSCTNCGICIKNCPVQAISRTDPKVLDEERCITCMRCVKVCPTGGRKIATLIRIAVGRKLKKVCAGRKEPEFIL